MKKWTILLSSRRLTMSLAVAAFGLLTVGSTAQVDAPQYAPYKSIPGAQKIDFRLLRSADSARQSKSTLGVSMSKGVQRDASGALLIELVASEVDDALLDAVAATGARIDFASERFRRITVAVDDPQVIYDLAAIDGVYLIRAVAPYVTNGAGAALGQGDTSLRADLVTDEYGVDGTGVKVGIISDSFASEYTLPPLRTDDFAESGSIVALTKTLPPDEYTLVAQTDDLAKVRLSWTSTSSLLTSTISYPPEQEACNTRFPLLGFGDTKEYDSKELPTYPSGSCGGGSSFVLFAFKVPDGFDATVDFVATVGQGADLTLSIRTDCTNSASEIACAEGEQLKGVSGMVNQVSGDLPPFVSVIKDPDVTAFGQVSNEGAAMGELVYDIASGADIGFYTALGGEAVFAEGIYRLSNFIFDPDDEPFGARVIVDDILYLREPVYQTGIIAKAIEDVVDQANVTYFSAAGNAANYGYRLVYRDVKGGTDTAYPPSGNDLMKWPNGSGYLPIHLEPGASIAAYVQWNQPWESLSGQGRGAQIDLNVFLAEDDDADGIADAVNDLNNPARISTNVQGNSEFNAAFGDPYEEVFYENKSNVAQTVYLVIDHFWGATDNIPQLAGVPLEVAVFFPSVGDGVTIGDIDPLDISTGGPTVWGHMMSPSAIAVGAVNWFDTPPWETSYGETDAIDVESFSATGGPLRMYFDATGNAKEVEVYKPEISAVDGNNTTFFPGFENNDPGRPIGNFDLDQFPNFFGTSASAPNAAAVAALLLQLNPYLTPKQVYAAMVETAIDVTGSRAEIGRDKNSGNGLIDAFNAAKYVEDNFGIFAGTEAPYVQQFTFEGVAEGWQGEFPGAPYTAPFFMGDDNSLNITAINNVNTLGWLKSPLFIASPVIRISDPDLEVNATTGSDSLLRATFFVASDALTTADTPIFRLRQSTASFEQSDVLVITSAGAGALAPSISTDAKTYRHYFSLPPASARFNLFVDLLGFGAEGADGTTLSIDRIDLESLVGGPNALTDSELESLQLFYISGGEAFGWDLRTFGEMMGEVKGDLTGGGLMLGPVEDPAVPSFGFWNSPEDSPKVFLRKNRLYRATFRVTTDAAASAKMTIPTIRCRVNDSSYNLSAYVDINSVANNANVPVAGETVDYHLYFEAPDELVGNAVNFSIDYLYLPGMGKDSTVKVYLQSIRVDSFQRPVGP